MLPRMTAVEPGQAPRDRTGCQDDEVDLAVCHRPRWVQLCGQVTTAAVLSVAVFSAYRMLKLAEWRPPASEAQRVVMEGLALLAAGVIGLAAALVALPDHSTWLVWATRGRATLGLHLPRHRLRALLLVPAATVGPLILLSQLVATSLGATGVATSPDPRPAAARAGGWIGGLLSQWVSAALAEELLFRGLLVLAVTQLPLFRRRPRLVLLPMLASSALFGAFHLSFSVDNAVSAGVAGLVFGVLVLLSG
jgi:membrane protease YdiL (CAAX protease family)